MTEHRLRDLEKEGLLHPHASSTRPEWIVPPADHRVPNPQKGYWFLSPSSTATGSDPL